MRKTIQVKGASEELRTRLASSAERNFRSLNQEALARLQFSFDLEDALVSKFIRIGSMRHWRGRYGQGASSG